nr:MAG TPA: hypothetical protein [Caudoviricetes sp.]DAX80405.1 MAG TPA: hypothetical protein [Caudoviricetes sp.]
MKNNRFNQECVTPSGSIVVCDENGRKVELHCGNEEFVKIKIDGCVEQTGAENLRCDFMIIKKSEDIEIYIELKGQDIKKAARQIEETLKKHGLVSATKYAAIATSKIWSPRKNTNMDFAKKILHKLMPNRYFIKNDFIQLSYNGNKISKIN